MTFVLTSYAIAEWSSAAVSAAVAAMIWKRRSAPGARAFFLMMAAVFVWEVGAGMEAASVGVPTKMLFVGIMFLGTVSTAPLFLLFALDHRRNDWRPSRLLLAGLWVIPAATMALIATSGSHHLVWTAIVTQPGTTIAAYEHGPWWWVELIYSASLSLAAAYIVARTALRTQGMYVRQTTVLLAGLVLPWAACGLALSPVNPFPDLDPVPIGFAFTGLLLVLGVQRFRLLDLVPVARDRLVAIMADGLVVLDGRLRIVDLNPAAEQLFAVNRGVIGERLQDALPILEPALAATVVPQAALDITLPGHPVRHCDVRSSAITARAGGGRLLVIRDLTDRKVLELGRERLIGELRAALANIQALEDLLPICASCKKIRDDRGYWSTVEKYFADHSSIQFSHGLCPDCIRKLYPDLAGGVPRGDDPRTGGT